MAYRIEYFQGGLEIGHTMWTGSFESAIERAKDKAPLHEANFARIVDVDGCGAEIWSERFDA